MIAMREAVLRRPRSVMTMMVVMLIAGITLYELWLKREAKT
jgi:hypothetical protein